MLQVKWDLGIRSLVPQWRGFFSKKFLADDLMAGTSVACVAVPLSLAIALASGVKPEIGLITAIIAGIVCAFFGGTPLAVSGPAAAMSVLIAANVEKFGLSGLLVVGVLAGLLQLFSGLFYLGRLARFVPTPVIAGFTAGIGAIIIIGQLPRALGLPPPDQAHVVDVITHLGNLIHAMHPMVFITTLLSIFIMRGFPRVLPQIPAPLFAVIIPTVIVAAFGLSDVPTVGNIPRSLSMPSMPSFDGLPWRDIIAAAFVVYFLASLETLLSSSAIDKVTRGAKHNPDQELIGQGLGNIASAFFGGIPVTGVIARSALNVRAGAKTRRSSIFHSIMLIAVVYLLAPAISLIPIAALAGILLSVAASMINLDEVRNLWRASKMETAVYAITFVSIVLVDLVAGVQMGILAAVIIALVRISQTQVFLQKTQNASPYRVSLGGALTFLSSAKIERLHSMLEKAERGDHVIVDVGSVSTMDTSGAALLYDFAQHLKQRGVTVIVKGLSERFDKMISTCCEELELPYTSAVTESDVQELCKTSEIGVINSRIAHGVGRFTGETLQNDRGIMQKIAEGQQPHTLFICCSDSRLNPNLLTSTDPGELFIVRNVGNVIPRHSDEDGGEGAAIEFSLGQLKIKNIIVCGHSSCGAIHACCTAPNLKPFPNLDRWLGHIRPELKKNPLSSTLSVDDASKLNVLSQIRNLASYPLIGDRLKAGTISVHGWFYDVTKQEISQWDPQSESFLPLVDKFVDRGVAAASSRLTLETGTKRNLTLL